MAKREITPEVVERLKKAKLEAEFGEEEAGKDLGRDWLFEEHDWTAATNLCAQMAGMGDTWDTLFKSDQGDAYAPSERLYLVMYPEEVLVRQAAGKFWQYRCGKEYPSPVFLRCFAEAVIEGVEEAEEMGL